MLQCSIICFTLNIASYSLSAGVYFMATIMQFNDNYSEKIQLLNGTYIRLRLIRPDDKQHMVNAFDHLSEGSRYKRFLGAKKALSAAELRYFTEIDQKNHFALGALDLNDCDHETGFAGVARFIRLPTDRQCAEVGITVIDNAQGKGVGRHLIERLLCAAIERGISRLRFECLAENQDIKRLIKKLNKHVKFIHEHELLIAEVELPKDMNQYPLDFIENLSVLIRAFSSQNLILYTDFTFGMFKRALETATDCSMINEDRLSMWTKLDKAS